MISIQVQGQSKALCEDITTSILAFVRPAGLKLRRLSPTVIYIDEPTDQKEINEMKSIKEEHGEQARGPNYPAMLTQTKQKVSITLAVSPSVHVFESDQILLGPGEVELTGFPGQSFDVVADIRHNALTAPTPVYIGIGSGDEMGPKSNVQRIYIGRYTLPTLHGMPAPGASGQYGIPVPVSQSAGALILHNCAQSVNSGGTSGKAWER